MNNKIQPPKPWNVLYKNLFEIRYREESIEIVSGGLSAMLKNVDRLISDAKFLVNSNHSTIF